MHTLTESIREMGVTNTTDDWQTGGHHGPPPPGHPGQLPHGHAPPPGAPHGPPPPPPGGPGVMHHHRPQMPPGPPPNPQNIQRMLDENAAIIKTITEYQGMGKVTEAVQYQWTLHRNLMYLASIADSNQNLQNLLPPPGMIQQGAPPGYFRCYVLQQTDHSGCAKLLVDFKTKVPF